MATIKKKKRLVRAALVAGLVTALGAGQLAANASPYTHPAVVSEDPAMAMPVLALTGHGQPKPIAYTVAEAGNQIVVGGRFSRRRERQPHGPVQPAQRLRLRTPSTGAVNPGFAPDVDGDVWGPGPTAPGSTSGGRFLNVNGIYRPALAKLNLATGRARPALPADVHRRPGVRHRHGPRAADRVRHVPEADRVPEPDHRQADDLPRPRRSVAGCPTATRRRSSTSTSAPTAATDRGRQLPDRRRSRSGPGCSCSTSSATGSTAVERGTTSRSARSARRTAPTPRPTSSTSSSRPTARGSRSRPSGSCGRPGYKGLMLCDAVSRFETDNLDPSAPTWINYTGGDSLKSVAVTDAAVYVQGHSRWLDNPDGRGLRRAGRRGPSRRWGRRPRHGQGTAVEPGDAAAGRWLRHPGDGDRRVVRHRRDPVRREVPQRHPLRAPPLGRA